ncbi:unnamed protein product [Amaranthus hypochondriacus]
MANSQLKFVVYVACLFAMAMIVSAHEGHHHAHAPSPMPKSGDKGGSTSLAPFSALVVALAGFVFSVARF